MSQPINETLALQPGEAFHLCYCHGMIRMRVGEPATCRCGRVWRITKAGTVRMGKA